MEFISLFSLDRLVSSLASALIHFCWQAVVIALLLKIFLSVTKKQAIRLRYYCAVGALMACFVLPLLTFNNAYQLSAPSNTIIAENSRTDSFLLDEISAIDDIIFGTLLVNPDAIRSFGLSWLPHLDGGLLVAIWSIGFCLMLFRLCYNLNQTYRLTSFGTSKVEQDIDRIVARILVSFDIKRRVRVLRSTLVNVPVVIGWLRPTVLLPIAVTIGLERQQLELILAHELAHVKRLDFLVNLIQSSLQVIFFYHPCVYWINKVLREEREYICDSMALASFSNEPEGRLELAKALLNIEELKEGNLQLVAVAASDGHLRNRINRIVLSDKHSLPSAKGFLVSSMVMLLSFAAIAVTTEQSRYRKVSFIETTEGLNFAQKHPKPSTSVEHRQFPQARLSKISLTKNEKKEEIETGQSRNEYSTTDVAKTSVRPKTRQTLNPNNTAVRSAKPILLKPNSSQTKSANNDRLALAIIDDETKKSSQISARQGGADSVIPRSHVRNKRVQKDINLEKLPGHDKTKVVVETVANLEKTLLRSEVKAIAAPIKVSLLDTKSADVFIEPKAINTPYPIYPSNAYSYKLSGKIKVDFVINQQGRVTEAKFEQGTPRVFVREIKSKLKKWRYRPAVRNGVEVAYDSSVYFEFEFPDEESLYPYQFGTRIKRKIR